MNVEVKLLTQCQEHIPELATLWIAAVRPDNERSRRVMEKAGMAYIGIVDFRGSPWLCYEIHNHQIDFTKIQLGPAGTIVRKPTVTLKYLI